MRLSLLLFVLFIQLKVWGQDTTVDSASLIKSVKNYLVGEQEREWIFESFDVDMSLPNKCYSGGSFIFTKNNTVKFRNCIDNKLSDKEFSWKLNFKKPHHIVLSIQNDEDYFINIYEDPDREGVLWMELTSIDGETNRFSDFYQLIYTP
ncbi:hypothetical protein [Ekhidna sp.]|jgi:hypothetical protein|uniref:hypothetical protein n=1 Tax=Ekhidna sp. TaxID=2608089 RepID=UPI0032ECFE8D